MLGTMWDMLGHPGMSRDIMGDLGPGTCAGYGGGHVGTSWNVLRYNGGLGTWDLCWVRCGTCWDILGCPKI